MSKNSFASEKVMRSYLNALLIEDDNDVVKPQKVAEAAKPVAKLLEKVSVIERPAQVKPEVKAKPEVVKAPVIDVTTSNAVAQQAKLKAQTCKAKPKSYHQGDFQALFFDVAGLTVAVPLTELGGIHNMTKLNNLIGKPDWFMGVMVNRDQQLSVVNTAKWVMPEKYDNELENSINYQYIIMLDNSSWGLACEKLINTVTLTQDDVKWREHSGRRPWLAGLIKERMCALLDVGALIEMLEQGHSSQNDGT